MNYADKDMIDLTSDADEFYTDAGVGEWKETMVFDLMFEAVHSMTLAEAQAKLEQIIRKELEELPLDTLVTLHKERGFDL